MTAERFVPDPHGDGTRVYRTGDRARLAQGQVEFLGRADDQVKIRGYRVEPGEVGEVLRGMEGVHEAVVLPLALESDPARLQLVGYCVTAPDVAASALLTQLQAQLPDYMVPAHLVLLEQLPLTANGKLDKRALPKPEVAGKAYVAPAGEVEEKLAAIWADVLKLEQVGSTDNFFELGGDSILSLQIIARAKRQGIKLTPKQLFEKQTVAALAQVARVIQDKPQAAVVQPEADGPLPLLPIQARFFDTAIAQRHHWNQSVLLKPLQTLQAQALDKALLALVDEHEALRLAFTEHAGKWQAAPRTTPVQALLQVVTLDSLAALETAANEVQASLDLARGELFRATLFELADGQQRLLLAVHHLVVDGVSWRILFEDLQTAYQQASLGQAVSLPSRSAPCANGRDSLMTMRAAKTCRLNVITGSRPRSSPRASCLAITRKANATCARRRMPPPAWTKP